MAIRNKSSCSKRIFLLKPISYRMRNFSSNVDTNFSSTFDSNFSSNVTLRPRWLYNGEVTSDLIHRVTGRRSLTPLVCAGCLLTGLEAPCSGKSGGFRLRSARAKAACNSVNRQPAQTSGVKKCFPFLWEWLHRYRVTLVETNFSSKVDINFSSNVDTNFSSNVDTNFSSNADTDFSSDTRENQHPAIRCTNRMYNRRLERKLWVNNMRKSTFLTHSKRVTMSSPKIWMLPFYACIVFYPLSMKNWPRKSTFFGHIPKTFSLALFFLEYLAWFSTDPERSALFINGLARDFF